MAKTKKIYRYVNRLAKRCEWCKGRGWVNMFGGIECSSCNGTGGEYKQAKILVSEEVIE